MMNSLSISLLFSVVVSTFCHTSMPLFMWSDSDILGDVEPNTLYDDLRFASKIESLISQSNKPETLVLFVIDELSSDEFFKHAKSFDKSSQLGGDFVEFKTTFESAKHSFFTPYASVAGEASDEGVPYSAAAVDRLTTQLGSDGVVRVHAADDAQLTLTRIDAALAAPPAALVVYLDSTRLSFKQISALVEQTNAKLPAGHVSTLLADSAGAAARLRALQAVGNSTNHGGLAPPGIFDAGMIIALILGIVGCALCQFCKLQTPVAFLNPPKKSKNKLQ
mmetsp:Transcript_13201/g.22690  ORF Transcript_13201/g.22690 Transcript_13201/m.22690 type:complete len:278 (+) Transcript_13201:30-863(+)